MENPDALIEMILSWAKGDSRVSAVVLTGSRARADRVDQWSDLDVELIGPVPRDLARDDVWLRCVGPDMVTLPFDLEDLITRLVVLPRGRKIDFSFWSEDRITTMVKQGLNDLYERGYQVLLDKTALTSGLPAATGLPEVPAPPGQVEFTRLESEFWFEATQVAVYLARGDLWVVKFREHTMHTCLLTMLGWQAQYDRSNPRFTWHIGHHMDEWLSASDYKAAGEVFTHFDPPDTIRGISAAMDLFEAATASASSELSLEHRPELAQNARTYVLAMLAAPHRDEP